MILQTVFSFLPLFFNYVKLVISRTWNEYFFFHGPLSAFDTDTQNTHGLTAEKTNLRYWRETIGIFFETQNFCLNIWLYCITKSKLDRIGPRSFWDLFKISCQYWAQVYLTLEILTPKSSTKIKYIFPGPRTFWVSSFHHN